MRAGILGPMSIRAVLGPLRAAATASDAAPLQIVAWLAQLAAAAAGAPSGLLDPLESFGAGSGGAELGPLPAGLRGPLVAVLGVEDDGISVAHRLGQVYEAVLDRDRRRRGGVFFTPPGVADALVEHAWPDGPGARRVWDPTVGGGAFLLAAATAMLRRGVAPQLAVRHVWGSDIDPGAVVVARFALRWWLWQHGAGVVDTVDRVVVADALAADPWGAEEPGGEGFDLVVGNPPFLGQLRSHSARSEDAREAIAARFGVAGRGYVDDALLFVLAALRAVRPGGRVALVQPESVLATAHGAPARSAIASQAQLYGLWSGGAGVFPGVGVRVCAPVLVACREGDRVGATVRRWSGVDFTALADAAAPSEGRWAPLLGAAGSVPEVDRASWHVSGKLSDLATATAGFRDQYYGLLPHVIEDEPGPTARPQGIGLEERARWPQLVTVGMIDPLVCHWGIRPVRFGGRPWLRPVVDLAGLEAGNPTLARWVGRRLVPKVVLAPQGRVLEVVVDRDGCWVPSVPVVSIEPLTDRLDGPDASQATSGTDAQVELLWRIAAVLLSPPFTALAYREHAGTGLSAGTVRIAARQVVAAPLPAHEGPWNAATVALVAAANTAHGDRIAQITNLREFGRQMTMAFGLEPTDDLQEWWIGRVAGRHRHDDQTSDSSRG